MKYEKATAQLIQYENKDIIVTSGCNYLANMASDYASNWGNSDYECVSKANIETHVYCVSTSSSGHGV